MSVREQRWAGTIDIAEYRYPAVEYPPENQTTMPSDRAYWITLSFVPRVGGKTFRALVDRFGSPAEAFAAPEGELAAVPGVTPGTAKKIKAYARRVEAIEEETFALADQGIGLTCLADPEYPVNLSYLRDAPPILYYRGLLHPGEGQGVAVVGTRTPEPRARKYARDLAGALADRGIVVVSGLALGIDTAAHEGCVEAEGRTVAVLGSGIAHTTPVENTELAEQILRQGAVLSEQKPTAQASRNNLMARNRIIAGLSLGLIVVQSRAAGGALAAAERAARAGRALFTVDFGDPSEEYAGNRKLQSLGATLLPAADGRAAAIVQEAVASVELKREAGWTLQSASDVQLRLFEA